jgi:hypothetical protein
VVLQTRRRFVEHPRPVRISQDKGVLVGARLDDVGVPALAVPLEQDVQRRLGRAAALVTTSVSHMGSLL